MACSPSLRRNRGEPPHGNFNAGSRLCWQPVIGESHWRSPGCRVYGRFPSFRRAMLRGCLGRGRAGANAIPFAFILFVRTTCHENRTISQGNSSIAAFFGPFVALGCSSPLCRMRNPALLDTFLYWGGVRVFPSPPSSWKWSETCAANKRAPTSYLSVHSFHHSVPDTLFPDRLSMQEDEG